MQRQESVQKTFNNDVSAGKRMTVGKVMPHARLIEVISVFILNIQLDFF